MDSKAIQFKFPALKISSSRRLLPDYLPVLPPDELPSAGNMKQIKKYTRIVSV